MQKDRDGRVPDRGQNSLYEELAAYGASDYYPCHMPGHKRNKDAGPMAAYYGIDITEIDGFDDLHHAEGILLDAQRRANRLYGGEDAETFFLVNGSTCGVLASVMTAAGRGEKILAARNCHKSVYHAAILQELDLRYYYPPVLEEYGICGGVDAEDIGGLLRKYPDCRAVVITSPTYEGILSNVGSIAEAVHAQGKILIVDEAHGAHLGLNEAVPSGAVSAGADLVIHSLHKTLPAMTQTALLHVQGKRVDREKLRRYLRMLQTSSPSYVLMASMDSCIRYMETKGAERYAFLRRQYDAFCGKIEQCRHIRVGNMTYGKTMAEPLRGQAAGAPGGRSCPMAGWDIGKLVIYTEDRVLNGRQLYDLLREDYHLQMEMAAERYVLAIMTILDTQEGWQRLADALCRIDDRIEAGEICRDIRVEEGGGHAREQGGKPDAAVDREDGMTAARAYLGERAEVSLADCVGKVAADFINLYPPGIPLVVPGEVIGEELPAQIRKYQAMGLLVQGVTDDGKTTVVASGFRFHGR